MVGLCHRGSFPGLEGTVTNQSQIAVLSALLSRALGAWGAGDTHMRGLSPDERKALSEAIEVLRRVGDGQRGSLDENRRQR